MTKFARNITLSLLFAAALAGALACGAMHQGATAFAVPADTASSSESVADTSSSSESSQETTGTESSASSSDASKSSKEETTSKGKKSSKAEKAENESKSPRGKVTQKKKKEAAKRKRVNKIVAYLATLANQLEQATEDLREIKAKRKEASKKVKKAKQRVENAKTDLKAARKSLNASVREIYKTGDVSFMSVILGAADFEDFTTRLYLLENVALSRQDTIANVQAKRAKYDSEVEKYEQVLAEKEELEAQVEARNATISSSIESQLKLIKKLDPSMLKAVNNLDSVNATRKWLAKYGNSSSKKGSHPEIVSIASTYLGVPYVWGGETPAGFDCSGLVMYCYAKIGISLPHFARSQYDCGTKINADALMPGDLVFFGPNVEGIHHVGIYVGEGKYIQAPRTGDVVKVSELSARNDYVGACRP